jgi:hypothetical protein
VLQDENLFYDSCGEQLAYFNPINSDPASAQFPMPNPGSFGTNAWCDSALGFIPGFSVGLLFQAMWGDCCSWSTLCEQHGEKLSLSRSLSLSLRNQE